MRGSGWGEVDIDESRRKRNGRMRRRKMEEKKGDERKEEEECISAGHYIWRSVQSAST
jgi:hypothetical protein